MKPTFPLFRLPENAITQVLGNMYCYQLFYISLASTRAKTLVTSTRLETDRINIKIDSFIDVEVFFRDKTTMVLYFYYEEDNDLNAALPVNDQNRVLPVDLTLPVDAFLLWGETVQSSTLFNFIDWMNHIRTIFCFTKPPNLRFYHECERFDVQYLKEAIGNVDVLRVDSEVTLVYSKEVLKYFNAPN